VPIASCLREVDGQFLGEIQHRGRAVLVRQPCCHLTQRG
jgi:hypothetical protein